jgi:hypothetical protein
MTTGNQTNVTQAIDTYFAFLNETDPARLRHLANETWAEGAHYVDPHHDGRGRDVLVSLVEGVHEGYAGFTFRRSTGIDVVANQARYGWEFNAPDGTVVLRGVDFSVLDTDGRLKQVTGFHGDLPSL